MGMFKLTCGKCGSIYILEKSGRNILGREGDSIIYGEGIQRKCTECDNEDFTIFRTWVKQG
ncbi:MAG TPA: hypothetical protein VEB00_05695 [Clostridia bacterium]|nr:hypothetical protein [Clostridia bacterium]